MKVEQIKEIVNNLTGEILGKTDIVTEDLSNIVDIGKELFSVTDVDNYVKKLVNHIGKVIFVNRTYTGTAPSVLMDGWEFGSVLEKVTAELPNAEENDSWQLESGASYDQDVFYAPQVSAKFFNSRVTFDIPMSFTERQVKDSFSSAQQLNGFLSMLYNSVDKAMSVRLDGLVQRTINNMIAETVHSDLPDGDYTQTGVKAVNLLKLYNDKYKQSLTSETAITNPDFVRYASYIIGLYMDRLSKMSTLFNVGGKERFTDKQHLHIVMLSEFQKASNVYLQSDTFNNEFTALPNAECVPYWQGSGTDYSFANTSEIHVNIKDRNGDTAEIALTGVLGVMFDRDALGVSNLDKRVTSHYNARAEFFTNYYKMDAGYFNDLNENFVVFFVA